MLDLYTLLEVKRYARHFRRGGFELWLNTEIEKAKRYLLKGDDREA